VRSYTSLSGMAVDFAATTKAYKAAEAIFAQARAPTVIKIGRRESGDANHAAALDAIIAQDNDWYCLLTTYKAKADIEAIAAYIETQAKIFIASSEDADVLTSVSTDVAAVLKAAGYKRTAYMWHHQSGVDASGVSYTVTNGVATLTQASHGRKVGDPIVFSGSTGSSINGDNVVATVTDSGHFTVLTSAANEAGPDTVSYFAGYTFPECAWAGAELSSVPGSETWKFKQLAGIIPAPSSSLTASQETIAVGKNANLYTPLGGVGHTHEGIMAGGRFIDVERGVDWLEAKLGEAIANRLLNLPKVPYTDAGATILYADIASVMDQGVTNGLLGPLLDNSGKFYNITIPKVKTQLTADRTARRFPGITVQAQLAGAVHSLDITVNAQI
jgi:hypothetical protein